MSYKRLHFEREKCTSCHYCELACAMRKTGLFEREHSTIHIARDFPADAVAIEPRLCDRCDKCIAVCPRKCITADRGFLVVEFESCTSCWACVDVCEPGAITMIDVTPLVCGDCAQRGVKPRVRKLPHICDLCEGDPECVKWCPKEALSLEEVEEQAKAGVH